MIKILIVMFLILSATCTTYAAAEIQINLPEYKLRLIRDGILVKEYDIAIGAVENKTPVGNYKITEKEANPTWYPTENQRKQGEKTTAPGPDNPLGIRWLRYDGAYGIHGTNEEEKVGFGYAVSHGCIRMRNSDVAELYDQVEVGTPVKIVYQSIVLNNRADGLYVNLLPDVYKQNTNSLEDYKNVLHKYVATYLDMASPPNFSSENIKSFRIQRLL